MSASAVELTLSMPLQSPRQALVARQAMEADRILRENEVSVRYTAAGATLIVGFAAASDRILRTVVNSTIDSLKSIVECFDEFDN